MFAGSQLGNMSLSDLLEGVAWALGILAVSSIAYRLIPFKYRGPTPPRDPASATLEAADGCGERVPSAAPSIMDQRQV